MLRTLSGRDLLRRSPTEIFGAFTSIAPDPQAMKQLEKVVQGLESDSYPERERASRALEELGAPGLLAAMRRDNSDLSAEAASRLNAFVSRHSGESSESPAAALKDPAFLLDCMDDDDINVRVAATAALEKLLGRTVDFDPKLNDQARAAAIDALRARLNPATSRGRDR
jgi:hypothetical protein